jgi:hypothetical protein
MPKKKGEQNEPSGEVTGASAFPNELFRPPLGPIRARRNSTISGETLSSARQIEQ